MRFGRLLLSIFPLNSVQLSVRLLRTCDRVGEACCRRRLIETNSNESPQGCLGSMAFWKILRSFVFLALNDVSKLSFCANKRILW